MFNNNICTIGDSNSESDKVADKAIVQGALRVAREPAAAPLLLLRRAPSTGVTVGEWAVSSGRAAGAASILAWIGRSFSINFSISIANFAK